MLLLHGEDLGGRACIETGVELRGAVVACGGHPRVAWPFGDTAQSFVNAAGADAAARIKDTLGVEESQISALDAELIAEQAQRCQVTSVITPEAPVGPLADGLALLTQELGSSGITLHRIRNPWDARAWPHALKGFFSFRQRIPQLLQQAGLA